MVTLLIILFAVGAVVGLMLRKNQHPAGTGLLVVCSMLAVLAGVGKTVSGLGGPSHHERFAGDLEMVRFTMASEFGRYLAEAPAGTQALCILYPDDAENETLKDGLQDGLDGQIPLEFTMLERDASDDLDSISMSASKVAAMLDQHPGTDLLITMADLPYEGGRLANLLKKRKVRVAAARVLSPATLTPYHRAGILAGAVAYQENPTDLNSVKNGSPEEIFASQFILIPGKR